MGKRKAAVRAEKALSGDIAMEDVHRRAVEAEVSRADHLREVEEEAQRENDELWQRERHEIRQVETLSKDKASEALGILLAKAEKYTLFLQERIHFAHDDNDNDDGDGKEHEEVTLSKGKKRVKAMKSKEPEQDKKRKKKPSITQPRLLRGGVLRDYQLEGFQWLVGLYDNGLHGILADEMGLGKTVQTIALVAHLWEHKVFGPYIIVVPLSTASNWVREFQKWCPDIPVLLYHGSKDERKAMREKCLRFANTTRDLSKFPVTITTYDIVVRDRSLIQKCEWKNIIVDEGHRLKNFECKLIKELNFLAGDPIGRTRASKLLLTGTPLQNNLSELWSLLNFLMPEIFNDLEFFQSVFSFDGTDETSKEMLEKYQEDNIVEKLHKILQPFMMRRLKSQVEKTLPKKKEIVLYVSMTKDQREMYERIVKGELADMLEKITGNKTKLRNLLMQLRKCCLHPYLHFEPTDSNGNYQTDESLIKASGKLEIVDYMLSYFKKYGHKVLIFSQFTSMLDIIQDYLECLRPEWKMCRIDGGTSLEDRTRQMDDFNNEKEYFVFLLSTRAGGNGINLMSADTVIIFDSDWNPHQDSQAQDRTHRIGQTRDVVVYRLITAKSVELRILQRANSKRKLERVVCSGRRHNSKKSTTMDIDELKKLLRDDFTGYKNDNIGTLSEKTLNKLLVRKALFSDQIPLKDEGYEIVDHETATIVGKIQ